MDEKCKCTAATFLFISFIVTFSLMIFALVNCSTFNHNHVVVCTVAHVTFHRAPRQSFFLEKLVQLQFSVRKFTVRHVKSVNVRAFGRLGHPLE